MEAQWNFDDADQDGSEDQAVVECVPRQDGNCPASDSPCLAELMQSRDGYEPCTCGYSESFVEVLAGPDPAVTDACCFTIHLVTTQCMAGRPLFVDGAARVALPDERRDWTTDLDLRSLALDPEAGEVWLARAQAEHASIAAFARTILQLLALGASADLLSATQRALADEIRHAQTCFAVASLLLGRSVGPAELPLAAAPIDGGIEMLADDVLIGGCLGETGAAVRLRREARLSTSPSLRAILERIADDEMEHAALAFRTIRWLATNPSTAARTRAVANRFAAQVRADPLSTAAVEPLLRAALA
jgi:hypothetical protein